jgi:tetratricopeptide (TPR) repeat protein/nitrate/TMAO reductase-like tetraheme cytochrome c subunit
MKPKQVKQQAPSASLAAAGRRLRIAAILTAVSLLAAAAVWADWYYGLPDDAEAKYVGRQACIDCHRDQHEAWTGSHHDLAMDAATDETVLGDFNDATLEHYGITSRMFKRDGKFFIHTEGPDGQLADFEIKYVFGVTPLQQYMVEFDRPADMPESEVARLQVLRVSWDTKAKKWFHLDPPDVREKLDPSDDLHWTGIAQRWNNMCADCHSTNLRKEFDVATLTYHTTWSEIDVSCEACHGPGSLHVQLARGLSPFWDRKRGYALARLKIEGTGLAASINQIQACAPCHSRRRKVSDEYSAGCNYHDYFSNELLTATSYHADGQILDEVYEYGSFVQTKMYHKGVKCTDCHDPHSLRLKHEGNQVCTSCHQHPTGKYDGAIHHRHADGTPGAQCVSCHMPQTTYMQVDPRRDHSFRVPRPDLSVQFGTPNACTGCHLRDERLPGGQESGGGAVGNALRGVPDSGSQGPVARTQRPGVLARDDLKGLEYADWLRLAARGDEEVKAHLARVDRWADATYDKWFGPERKREPHFTEALAAARTYGDDAAAKLTALLKNREMPAIARATAAMELGAYVAADEAAFGAVGAAIADRDPTVRAAAVSSLQSNDPQFLFRHIAKTLEDERRIVRVEAAQSMSHAPQGEFRGDELKAMQRALDEAFAAGAVDNDRAGGHLVQGVLHENLREEEQAEEAYRTALRVEPLAIGPRSNLSELLDRRRQAALAQAQQLAQAGNVQAARDILALAGPLADEANRLRNAELGLLERDAVLVPDNAGLLMRLGYLRHLQGWRKEAGEAFAAAHFLEPRSPHFLLSLAVYLNDSGRPRDALPLVERLRALRPRDGEIEALEIDVRGKLRAGPVQ